MSDRKTIYQQLGKYFDAQQKNVETNFDPIKVRDKEEFERLKLQKQQQKYLANQWKKINKNIFNFNAANDAHRLTAYMDYDLMSYNDILGRALEILTEEACTLNEKGEILNVFSKSDRVKETIYDFFYNKLNVLTNLPVWVYQTLKYGDSFVNLALDDERGIVGCHQLPAMQMDRIEAGYIGGAYRINDDETVFQWRADSLVTFKYWQIAHFRLILDERRLPYGVSIFEKVRRLWKNLLLAEDAMLSAHIIRGIDRLVYYVDVGTIHHDDVLPYIDKMFARFKRKKHVDPRTGQVDLKENIIGIDQDIVIPKRGSNDASSVDKIEGKSEMDTNVVDYITEKIIASLGIPKPYLNFQETTGEGKNLSMQDIRLARTIMRIQQNILGELEKIAQIHLVLVGLDEEVDNFTLSLNNPSIQQELLRIDMLQQKISLYNDATDISNGIAAMSYTEAKKVILGMTEQEILNDVRRMRIERAAIAELERTDQVIKSTGLFKEIDNMYGDPNAPDATSDEEGEGEGEEGGIGGIGGGGGGFSNPSFSDISGGDEGGDDLDLGGDDLEEGDIDVDEGDSGEETEEI